MGQCYAEVLTKFDIILRNVRNSNIFFGGFLIMFSMDHTKIHQIRGPPFLTPCHVIPRFKMVTLENYIRYANDVPFKCIQQIERYNYKRFEQ